MTRLTRAQARTMGAGSHGLAAHYADSDCRFRDKLGSMSNDDTGEVLLTGATGFIGAAVLHELTAAGHAVAALVRTKAGAEVVRAAGARAVIGDLLAPTPPLNETIASAR